MSGYYEDFYRERREKVAEAARIITPRILEFIQPASVLDIGCAEGEWLSVFKEHGMEIHGVDGPWVKTSRLLIPERDFTSHDFKKPLDLGRQYDLVMSLEVAEHLQEEYAAPFIESLVRHGSVVLFSAAIPFQEGRGHRNEQWPDYWAKLFLMEEYHCIDCLRPILWNLPEAAPNYAQNMLLYIHRNSLGEFPAGNEKTPVFQQMPLSLVHPENYLKYADPTHILLRDVRRNIGTVMRHSLRRFLSRKTGSKK